MRRIASMAFTILAMILVVQNVAAASLQATPAGEETTIHGTITATGRYIFTWVEEDLCTLSFWDYDFTPNLIVIDETNHELASLPLASLPGEVTMAGAVGSQHAEVCSVPFEISVPSSSKYKVILDPYFESELISSVDLEAANGQVDIAFERQANDVGPDFHDRPAGELPGTDMYRIAGTFELFARPGDISFFALPIGGCLGMGGYEDIAAGQQITVSDETGTIIGIGELEPIYIPTPEGSGLDDSRCVFTFTIDVPDAAFYTIEMGRRGEMTYTKQDLEGAGWHVDLSIGP